MSDHPVPEWLTAELALNHSGIEIRWMPYGPGKTFVLPITGDAFYRMTVKKLMNQVMYRRYITGDSAPKWKLHPLTYFPDNDVVTDGRFVVFQKFTGSEEVQKLFDVVNDDGSLHPLDRRVIDAIHLRDGKFGAHEKAIKDVEAAPDRADAFAFGQLEETTGDLFERIHHDISKVATGGACVTADPLEDAIEIVNHEL